MVDKKSSYGSNLSLRSLTFSGKEPRGLLIEHPVVLGTTI